MPADQESYIKTVGDNYAPFTKAMYSDSDFFLSAGRGPSHTAKELVRSLEKIFGKKKVRQNPPSSPDLSLLDYRARNMLGAAQMPRRFAVRSFSRKAPVFQAIGVFFMWAGGVGGMCGRGSRKIRNARPRLRQ